MGIYEELGVPRIINAMGTYTIYGGYYAYMGSRNYDRDQILSTLVSLTQNTGNWFLAMEKEKSC